MGLSIGGLVLGGSYSEICCSNYSLVLGGFLNEICCSSTSSTILNGSCGLIWKSCHSSVVGGCRNCICAFTAINSSATVGGAFNCVLSADQASIIAGNNNHLASSSNGLILGGAFNCNVGSASSAILGGDCFLLCDSPCSSILGGCRNSICFSTYTHSLGRHNVARNSRTTLLFGGANTSDYSCDSAIIAGNSNKIVCTRIFGSNQAACNTVVLGGSNICASHSNTIYLSRNAVYVTNFELDFNSTTSCIGPLELNNYNADGVSLVDVDIVGTYFTGPACDVRSSFFYKKFSNIVIVCNQVGGNGPVCILGGCLFASYNSDATNFPAGALGSCQALCQNLNGNGLFVHVKNRASAASASKTVFTVKVSRLDA
jgi:hypothetical protein